METSIESATSRAGEQLAATGSLLLLVLLSAVVAVLVTAAFLAIRHARHPRMRHR